MDLIWKNNFELRTDLGLRRVCKESYKPQLGFGYALARVSFIVAQRCRLYLPGQWMNGICHRIVLRYLEKKYGDVALEFNNLRERTQDVTACKIWCCWWQGYDAAPPLVKLCLDSIRLQAGGCEVCLISRENYGNYVSIPTHIVEKYNQGRISTAHFCDVIRVNLLARCGGLWIDATVFVSGGIPQDIFARPFYSIRDGKSRYNISNGRWTTFLLASQGSVLMAFLSRMYEAYWERENEVLDYFLFDYLIEFAYRNNLAVTNEIDAVPLNNRCVHDLQPALMQHFDPEQIGLILESGLFFKLTYKFNRNKNAERLLHVLAEYNRSFSTKSM